MGFLINEGRNGVHRHGSLLKARDYYVSQHTQHTLVCLQHLWEGGSENAQGDAHAGLRPKPCHCMHAPEPQHAHCTNMRAFHLHVRMPTTMAMHVKHSCTAPARIEGRDSVISVRVKTRK